MNIRVITLTNVFWPTGRLMGLKVTVDGFAYLFTYSYIWSSTFMENINVI